MFNSMIEINPIIECYSFNMQLSCITALDGASLLTESETKSGGTCQRSTEYPIPYL